MPSSAEPGWSTSTNDDGVSAPAPWLGGLLTGPDEGGPRRGKLSVPQVPYSKEGLLRTIGFANSKLQGLSSSFTKTWQGEATSWYSPGQIESMIYDNECHQKLERRSWGLLNYNELMSPTDGEAASPGLWRCLIHSRVEIVDKLILASVIGTCLTAPLTYCWRCTWEERLSVCRGDTYKFLMADASFDVVFLLVLTKFNTSFLDPEGNVEVVNRARIRSFLLSSPIYLLMILSLTAYIWIIFFGAPLIINNIKFFRVSLVIFPPDSLWRFQDVFFIRLARPLVLLVIASHWVACMFIYFGGLSQVLESCLVDDSCIYKMVDVRGHEFKASAEVSLYLTAFVDSLYMLTGGLDNPLGEGDSHRKKNFGSLLIVSIFCPIGCIVVSLFIAAVIREHTLKTALEMRHEEHMAFISRALRILNIPKELRRRVRSMHYFQKLGHDAEALGELFNRRNLSPPLETALLVYLYRENVVNSRYFLNKDPNYIIAVIRVLQDQVYIPGDYVTRYGEVGNHLFFIGRGVLSVLVPTGQNASVSNAQHVSNLQQKDFFGEIALIQDCVRTAWVRADSYVLVSALSRTSIEQIWQFFPKERETLVSVVESLLQKDLARSSALPAQPGGGSAFAGGDVSREASDRDDEKRDSCQSIKSSFWGNLTKATGEKVDIPRNCGQSRIMSPRLDEEDVRATARESLLQHEASMNCSVRATVASCRSSMTSTLSTQTVPLSRQASTTSRSAFEVVPPPPVNWCGFTQQQQPASLQESTQSVIGSTWDTAQHIEKRQAVLEKSVQGLAAAVDEVRGMLSLMHAKISEVPVPEPLHLSSSCSSSVFSAASDHVDAVATESMPLNTESMSRNMRQNASPESTSYATAFSTSSDHMTTCVHTPRPLAASASAVAGQVQLAEGRPNHAGISAVVGNGTETSPTLRSERNGEVNGNEEGATCNLSSIACQIVD
eukprot:TRINITY_DN74905_c0_g1_i1.p1 TRINITY_DN74905_c0_g1~~TRINITY_DN74905_c0_g1_i1.p1  ORF type:complete len:983 (+),score=137.88 TRINITY_DN74905_c0_g1_i1:106-2949(+)